MNAVMKFVSCAISSGLFMYVLATIVPKFKSEPRFKHYITAGFLLLFFHLLDGTSLKHVILLYLSIMLILKGLYQNSSFVSSLGALFLFIINLLSMMIATNISIMLFQEVMDFRLIVLGASFKSLLVYVLAVLVLTQYYKKAIRVFKKVNHLSRKLERVLVICNVMVFTLIILFQKIAFTNLVKIESFGIFSIVNGKEICFYMLSSYVLVTVLSFIVVVLINRLFIVDYSMENYKFKAETDLMTGTLSREAGLAHLKSEMSHALMHQTELTIAYVDINDLKKVNDIQGHKAGDLMIRTITSIIHENLRHRDEITRLGGDEFLVVFKKCNLDQAARIWMRVNDAFMAINQTRQYPFSLSVSVGFVAFDPNKHRDYLHLLHEADENMYAYKKRFKEKVL